MGNNQYPETLAAVIRVLRNYIMSKGVVAKHKLVFDDREKDGISFLWSKPKLVWGIGRKIHLNITCYRCEKKGYCKLYCPTINEEEEEYKDT